MPSEMSDGWLRACINDAVFYDMQPDPACLNK
jgi:hypothetical protein